MPKTQKPSNEAGQIRDSILKLLREATRFKKIIKKNLKADPGDLAGHRIYLNYVRRILEIHKTMIQAQSVDQESLLLVALRCVVLTLIEKGEAQSAEVVGNYLEEMGDKVRQKWLESKEPGRVTTKSGRSSSRRSPPSERPRPGKSESAPRKP